MNIKEFIVKTATLNFDIRIWQQFPEDHLLDGNESKALLSFIKELWTEKDIQVVADRILEQEGVNAVEVLPNYYKYNAVAIGVVYYKDWP